MLDRQRKPLFADPAIDVTDQSSLANPTLPDSDSRTAIRPNLRSPTELRRQASAAL